jgi:hypothetical protein
MTRWSILRIALIAGATGWNTGVVSAADRCMKAETVLMQAVCNIEMVQELPERFHHTYSAALPRLSPEGQAILKLDQERWELRTKAACIDHPEITASHRDGDNKRMMLILHDGTAVDPGPVNACLFEAFADRGAYLEAQPARHGDFLWQEVDFGRDAYCGSNLTAAGNRLSLERSLWRIDSPVNEATRRWNAMHANPPSEENADACAHDGQVAQYTTITFAQGDFVALQSIDRILYFKNSHDYAWGERPIYGKQAVHMAFVQVSTGRRLGATDFFVSGSGWESFIAKRAYANYLADMKARGETPQRSDAEYLAQAAEIDHWSVDSKSFAYELSATELGASGSSTRFHWKELRRYLRDDLPFAPDFE